MTPPSTLALQPTNSTMEPIETSTVLAKATSPSCNNSLPPFFRIPLEVRNQIYELLSPDKVVSQGYTADGSSDPDACKRAQSNFRHDGASCYPALMRVNRQIHSEMREVFYGKATFNARLLWRFDRIAFVDNMYPNDFNHRNFQNIRNLGTQVDLQLGDEKAQAYKLRFKEMAKSFSTSETHLRILRIYFNAKPIELWDLVEEEYNGSTEAIHSALERVLGPLREVIVTKGVMLTMSRFRPPMQSNRSVRMFGVGREPEREKARRFMLAYHFEAVAEEFLRELQDDIRSNTRKKLGWKGTSAVFGCVEAKPRQRRASLKWTRDGRLVRD